MSLKDKLLKLFGVETKDYEARKSGLGREFIGLLSPMTIWTSLELMQKEFFRKPITRQDRFLEYDIMDLENSDIGFALDLFAEESLPIMTNAGELFRIKTKYPEVEKTLKKLTKRLEINEKLYAFSRALAKYGEIFTYTIIYKDEGIKELLPLHPANVDPVIIEDEKTKTPKFVGWKSDILGSIVGEAEGIFPPYRLLQWRLPDYTAMNLEGRSMLANSVKCWKMLDMLEVMIQIYRLNRSVEKRIYKIDVGEADIVEAMRIVKEYRNNLQNVAQFQKDSGDWFKVKSPGDFLQEIFWPLRTGSNSSVEVLQAPGAVGEIADLEYFRNKLRVSLGIPTGYFDEKEGGGVNFDKGKYLAYQDIRFARKISRLQAGLRKSLKNLFRIHLTTLGISGSFDIEFQSVSIFETKMKAEILRDSVAVVKELMEFADEVGWNKGEWAKWLSSEYLNIPQDFLEKLQIKDNEEESSQVQSKEDKILDKLSSVEDDIKESLLTTLREKEKE